MFPKSLLFKLASGLLVIGIVLIIAMVNIYDSQVNQALEIPTGTLFEVKSGESAHQVLRNISSMAENPIYPITGKVWLKLHTANQSIKAGVYELERDMSVTDIFKILITGRQKQFSVALIEGLTFEEWLNVLQNTPYLENDWDESTSSRLLEKFSTAMGVSLSRFEGVVLADTYYFTAYSKVSEIVSRGFEAIQTKVEKAERHYTLPHVFTNVYQALILASIVEKETAVASERPLIAGVFINRLERKMRLQTDPTIIYGLGDEFDGDITREHLRRPTPYNTYVIKGLPPTPIAMVGEEAIDAVFLSEPTEYLYFVAKGDGSHYFSETLSEHNQAVRKYQLKRKE